MNTTVGRRSGLLAQTLFALSACAAWSSPVLAETPDVHASLKTVGILTGLLRPGAVPATDTSAPGLSLLSVDARNVSGSGVFASAYGYMQHQFASGPSGHGADLMLGHLGWASKDQMIRAQVGRIAVFTGGAQYQYMDGAAVTARLPASVRVDAWYGAGLYETFNNFFKAPVYGGRVAWVPWQYGHLGVGYQAVDDLPVTGAKGDPLNRRSLAVDGSLKLLEPLTLVGVYAHDLIENRLQQARLDLAYSWDKWLVLHAKTEVRDPLAWMSKTSIFSAFLQRTDGMVGGSFDLYTPGALTLSGGYDRFIINDNGMDGYRGFVEGRVKVDEAGRYNAGVAYARLYNGDNGYDQLRLFGSAKAMERLTITADIDTYLFMRKIRDEKASIRGGLALRYAVVRGLDAGLDGQIWRNPYFDAQALGLLTLTLREGLLFGEPAKPLGLVSGADANEVAKPSAPAAKKADDDAEEAPKPPEKTPEAPAPAPDKAPAPAPDKAPDAGGAKPADPAAGGTP